jgi:hypothetical protein
MQTIIIFFKESHSFQSDYNTLDGAGNLGFGLISMGEMEKMKKITKKYPIIFTYHNFSKKWRG